MIKFKIESQLKKFHKVMKSGRLHKVCKAAGVTKTSSENKSQ